MRDGLTNGGLVFGKTKDDDLNQLERGTLFRGYNPAIESSNSLTKRIKSAAAIIGAYADLKLHGMTHSPPFNGFFLSVVVNLTLQSMRYRKLLIKQTGNLAAECDIWACILECTGAFNNGF